MAIYVMYNVLLLKKSTLQSCVGLKGIIFGEIANPKGLTKH